MNMLSKTVTFAALFVAVIALPLTAQDSARVPVAPSTAPMDNVSMSLQGAELGSDGAYLVQVGGQYRIQVSSQLPDAYTALVYSHKGAWLGFALGTTDLDGNFGFSFRVPVPPAGKLQVKALVFDRNGEAQESEALAVRFLGMPDWTAQGGEQRQRGYSDINMSQSEKKKAIIKAQQASDVQNTGSPRRTANNSGQTMSLAEEKKAIIKAQQAADVQNAGNPRRIAGPRGGAAGLSEEEKRELKKRAAASSSDTAR